VVEVESIFVVVVVVDDKNLRFIVVAVFFFLPAIDSLPSSISSHHESSKALHIVVLPIPAKPATIMFNETIRGLSFNDSGVPIDFLVNVDSVAVLVGVSDSDDDNSGDSIGFVVIVDFVVVVGDDEATTPTLTHRRPNKKTNMDSEMILFILLSVSVVVLSNYYQCFKDHCRCFMCSQCYVLFIVM
jgi:hypothetical protein